MRHKLRSTFAVLSLLLAACAPAQSGTPGSATITVPFEMINNHAIVPVSINGSEPFQLILDTGMPAMGAVLYDTERVKSLNLPMDSAMRAAVGGAGGDGAQLQASIVVGQTLSIGKLEIGGAQLIVMPVLPDMGSYHEGVIGRELFANFVVELNYDDGILTFHDQKTFVAPEGAA
jgi:hypothetical protein